MAMQLFCLPLFLVCVSLQLAAFGQCEAAGDEDIDPRELARQLRSERCMFNFSLVKEFYREHKENENRDYQFPDQGKLAHNSERYCRVGTSSSARVCLLYAIMIM